MTPPNRSLRFVELIGAPAILHPDPPSAPHELAYLDDVAVISPPAPLVQPLKAALGVVNQRDRAMIGASGARDIAEFLRRVPGFQVTGKTGRTPLTTYHCLSDDARRRLLVWVDGRSAYAPNFVSGIEWAKISIDIELIKVFRGTNAAAYGSTAFLGIVNIVTRPASVMPRAHVTAGRESEHGLSGLDNSYRSHRIDARVDWQLHRDHQLEPHFSGVNNHAQTGVAGNPTEPLRKDGGGTAFDQIPGRHQFGPDDESNLTWFHQQEYVGDEGLTSLSDQLIDVEGLTSASVECNVTPLPPPLNRNSGAPIDIGGGYADIRVAELSAIFRPVNDKWIGGHYAYTNINSNDRFADASAPRQAFTFFAAMALPGGWKVSASHGFVGCMQ